MSDEPKRNFGGRPRKMPDEGKRSKFSCRLTEALRARVGVAAEGAGRSLSEEIEYRVAASFLASDIRQIVREEIAAALSGSSIHTVTEISAMRVQPMINDAFFKSPIAKQL